MWLESTTQVPLLPVRDDAPDRAPILPHDIPAASVDAMSAGSVPVALTGEQE